MPTILEAEEAHSLKVWRQQDSLRKAEIAFITDPARRPLDHWYAEICAAEMPPPNFHDRARQARWLARRDEYWIEVQQAVLEQAKIAAIKDRVDELREIQSVRHNTLELIQPRIIDGQKIYRVHPSSYEGMVRALCAIDTLVDKKRDMIMGMVEPDLRPRTRQTTSPLSPEEIQDFVRMLLESRRANQLALPPREEPDNDPAD